MKDIAMFELTEEQKLIKQNIHKFAGKELAPKASYWDDQGEFPWESLRKMSEVGLTGLRMPSLYGGSETDLISTGIAFEEVARFDHSCAIILCGCNITGRLLVHAVQGIRETCLPDIVNGKSTNAVQNQAASGANKAHPVTRAR